MRIGRYLEGDSAKMLTHEKEQTGNQEQYFCTSSDADIIYIAIHLDYPHSSSIISERFPTGMRAQMTDRPGSRPFFTGRSASLTGDRRAATSTRSLRTPRPP